MKRACVVVALAALAVAGRAAAATPEVQLAQRYAPALELSTDDRGCEDAAPFGPVNVNVVLDNDEVALRGPWDRTNVVKIAPTAQDLSRGLFDYHLDFPGDPLSPDCTYVTWQKRLDAQGKPPTAYAHVATDAAHPGELALQYWFFYVFNDFNNLHEGDWEMIQLNFDAADAAAALKTQPTEVGYSQHEGAERADWTSSKLRKVDGTHPVVYPAAGSHANFYSSALFLGRSAAQGVGCDDTRGPNTEVSPTLVDVPTTGYAGAFPWLEFQGRWGELQPAFYNGPTGPNMKQQWTEPITWSEIWRDRSYAVPTGGLGGNRATDFFCGAVATGSGILTWIVRNPLPGVLTLVGVVLLLIYAATRTTWSGSAALRLARRRTWGQLIASAWAMYRANLAVFLGIGVLFVPVAILITLLQYLLFHVLGFVPLVETLGKDNVSIAGLALSVGLLFTVVALAFVQAATAYTMQAIDRGEKVRALEAYRAALPNVPVLFGWVLLAALVVALLNLVIFAIPIAIWLIVRWSLLAQVIQLDDETRPGALRRSATLVRGHWWRVALFTFVVTGLGLLLGPLIGGLMLLVTSAAFNVVNLIAGIVYTATMPFVAIATTYLYHDLKTRAVLEARAPLPVGPLPAEV